MSTTASITVHDYGLADRLKKKGDEVDKQIDRFHQEILDLATRWVQVLAPHGKTGNLKRSILNRKQGSHGEIWQEDGIANYGKWVIDGRTTVSPKAKRWWFWYLNNQLGGNYTRKTEGGSFQAGPNDFFEKSIPLIEKDIHDKIPVLAKWLTEV